MRTASVDLVSGLLAPSAYPHPAPDVHLVQTHISYVFLAGEYAYKVKKPVDFGFLDYSTLARRRRFCQREVLLNGRLSSGLYLGVVPITCDDEGFHVAGRGRAVEYAVRMRRLPDDRMLDRLLARGEVTGEMMDAVADRVARFHAEARSGLAVARFGSIHRIRANWEETLQQLEPFVGRTLSSGQLAFLARFVDASLARHRHTFRRRLLKRRVRDCHGDLRCASVCFDRGIQIFDRIEFNQRFRYGDVASEVAFLAMDLTAEGRGDFATRFVSRYAQVSGDGGVWEVLPFYASYRAAVRGKVEAFRADEQDVPVRERREAQEAAGRMLALACRFANDARLPSVIMMHGLSGTGKTTLAEAMASQAPFEIFSSDQVRKEMAGVVPTARRVLPFRTGIYSLRFTRRTYREMCRRAQRALSKGHSVILDATFLKAWQRRWAVKMAQRAGALFFCLDCRAEEASVRARLVAREHGPQRSDARWPIYLAQRAFADAPRELDPWSLIEVDTGAALGAAVEHVLARLDAQQVRGSPAGECSLLPPSHPAAS